MILFGLHHQLKVITIHLMKKNKAYIQLTFIWIKTTQFIKEDM